MAALSCAWRLSSDDRIESITVYQRGWRLGGKGASSRGEHGRIEEHGLHVWLGYYDNAFRLMRECYDELDRPRTRPDCPIRSWRDAFAPSDVVGLAVRSSGEWADWTAVFATNDELPGEPEVTSAPMSPLQFVVRSQALVRDFLSSLDDRAGSIVLSADPTPPPTTVGGAMLVRRAIDAAAASALQATRMAAEGAERAAKLAPPLRASAELLEQIGDQLRRFVSAQGVSRRMVDLLDLVVTSMRGILADGLLTDPRGFSAINGEEYLDWLRRHGIASETLRSPLIRGVYDLVFGYRDGDPDRPGFAAGTGLYLSAKIFFDYKHSIFWKMQAGMGDVVFAPLFEALQKRGVMFKFFHDVRELEVSDDGSSIDGVRLVRQVTLTDPSTGYRPLRLYGELPCFPSVPDSEQIVGEVVRPATMETLWGRDHDAGTVHLRRGRDYDDLVFGIALGMVPFVCREILERDDRWRRMVHRIGTVATQSVQLWMRKTEDELRWSHTGSTLTGFGKPFDTVASMSHLLAAEGWPAHGRPGSVFYLCSTLSDGESAGRDYEGYLESEHDRVRSQAVRFLENELGYLLPGATNPNGFDWEVLCGPDGAVGPDRLDAQLIRANVDPSDRYVQSLPGTDRFRLRPDDSGFDNLYLAGDWTDCGVNAGCIEAAVISGLQAGNAVTGAERWDGISGAWAPLVGTDV